MCDGTKTDSIAAMKNLSFIFCLLALTFATASSADIPNPLLKPGTATRPGTPAGLPSLPPPPMPQEVTRTISAGTTSAVSDLRTTLAGYYVSAVVGKTAVLRQGGNAAPGQSGGVGLQPMNTPSQPLGASGGQSVANSGVVAIDRRSESVTVKDGEISLVGAHAILAEVRNESVALYYLASERPESSPVTARLPLVFSGTVDSTNGRLPRTPIERPDSAYVLSVRPDKPMLQSGSALPNGSQPGMPNNNGMSR